MSVITDKDGNSYNTVVIGTQEWITKPLKTTKYADGTAIANITNAGAWAADSSGAYCWYSNDIANKTDYGALYNWWSANNVKGLAYFESGGVAQAGWRIPTPADFATLIDYLGGTDVAGGKLKEIGFTHWTSPNTGADNSSGFTAVGGGYRDYNGLFWNLKDGAYYYDTLATDPFGNWMEYLFLAYNVDNAEINQGPDTISRNNGLSVVCVRDYAPPVTNSKCFPEYRFYISELSSVTNEVFPLNFLSTSLVDELEENQVFYRRKFSGSLIFGTRSRLIDADGITRNRIDDWTLFWGYEQANLCEKLYLTITKTVAGATTVYWEGYFSTTDGNFDIDKCTFEIFPLVYDAYADILDNVDIQSNILSVSPVITTRAVQGTIDVTFTRNRWLMDVINLLAVNIKFGATVSSDFFSVTPNYVTQSISNVTLLTIAQKSDIIRPASSNPATTALMSWKELMDILWAMFQVMWDYDPLTDTLNIEHISWFTSVAGMDLRTQVAARATNRYSYIKEEMPKYEKFAWMEADNINFIGDWIMYDSGCANPDPKTNLKETKVIVTTDLEYIINNPEAISDEGFVILCNYLDGGNYFVKLNASAYHNSDVRLNMDMSWGNLQDRFYRHNRVLIEGFMNGMVTTFWTAQKTKQQECYAILCEDYDPSDYITTELGETYLGGATAKVKRSELKPTGEIKFNLLYGPADNTPTLIEDIKWILIYEDGCGSFHAILSEAADDNLDILIKYIIYDSAGAVVCVNGAGVTWTIPITSTTHAYDIPAGACGPEDIPVGGCIWYLPHSWEVVGRPDWPIGFIEDKNCSC